MTVTPEMIEAADRANCAAEPDDGWQDETDMYPVIYEAMKDLDPEVESLREALRKAASIAHQAIASFSRDDGL